jgi:hypothetical protein
MEYRQVCAGFSCFWDSIGCEHRRGGECSFLIRRLAVIEPGLCGDRGGVVQDGTGCQVSGRAAYNRVAYRKGVYLYSYKNPYKPVMEEIIQSIQRQHRHNRNRNLFFGKNERILEWTPYTRNLLATYPREILQMDSEGQGARIVQYLTEQARLTFCATNQFMDISGRHSISLHAIYRALWDDIISALGNNDKDLDPLEKRHGRRVADWLMLTNPIVHAESDSSNPYVQQAVCAEYSAQTQIKVLRLDLDSLIEPVLDIGCGRSAHFVQYLRKKGIAAYGVDRFIHVAGKHLHRSDWLEFRLQRAQWGTIVSNLSFSHHFLHQHNRAGGQFHAYAKRYMEILQALRPGGSYHYAPQLPMIEMYLPPDQYAVSHHQVDDHFKNSIVRRRKGGSGEYSRLSPGIL